jgi:phage tail-like protein
MERSASEPFLNMRFRVEVEGMAETGVLEVVFPQARIAGKAGNGRRVQYGTMLLKRGVARSQDWHRWWEQARAARKGTARRVTVTLLDESGDSARSWTFPNARPLGYSLSSLNALGHDVLTETLELTVGGFEPA